MTTPASTASSGALPSDDFPDLLLALVRLLAREAARADFALRCLVAGTGDAK